MVRVVEAFAEFARPSPLEGEGREGGRSGLGLTCSHRDAAPTPLLPEAPRASGTLPLKGGGAFVAAEKECVA